MLRVRTILVPIDFSPTAFRVVEFSIALARKFRAALHIVHVRPPNERSEVAQSGNLMSRALESVDFLSDRLTDIERKCLFEFPLDHCHVFAGRPDEEICKAARLLDADLIVLGTRGESGLKRLLLGSTTERVIRHAPCPVLIVRGAKISLGRILAPVDFSDCSAIGAKFAREWAKKFKARLRLLHAIPPSSELLLDRRLAAAELALTKWTQRAARNNMRKFRQKQLARSAGVETKLETGRPVDVICREAERDQIDLIVISSHGRTGLRRAMIGSVAEQVARYAKCSVLVVPNHPLSQAPENLRR